MLVTQALALKPSVEVAAVAARSCFHGSSICLLSPACTWSRRDAASVKESGIWQGQRHWHAQPLTMWHDCRQCVCPATVAPGLVFQLPWQPNKQPNVILISEVESARVCLCCLQLRVLANSEGVGGGGGAMKRFRKLELDCSHLWGASDS